MKEDGGWDNTRSPLPLRQRGAGDEGHPPSASGPAADTAVGSNICPTFDPQPVANSAGRRQPMA